MRIARLIPRAAAALAAAAVAGACGGSRPNYPVTERSRSFSDMDASQAGAAPAAAQGVTAERITRARAEPQNWLTYYGAYDGQRFSALDQIAAANVARLQPAWVFQAGVIGLIATPASYAFEAAPIVVDGVMYLTGWDGYVWALDAATGKVYWRYRHAIPLDVPLCCGNVNRGAAVAQGRVLVATQNGHLVALDATTGRVVWDRVFADVRAGESATLAPLVVKNTVVVGASGGEYGTRGHLDAFDVATGERRWRRYTVPRPGEPGSETWTGDAWQRGGGSVWVTGSYDPELDLMYWGTANPGPDFDGSAREGANLYTNSVIAVDPDDGAIRWHYQWTPHDVWDYDGVNENILFDDADGRKLLAHFDRNGYLFILDRTNGRLVRASRFAERVTWGDIDATTGRVTVRLTPTPEGVEICPSPSGAKEWPHAAYSPRTRLLYTPVIEKCGRFKSRRQEFREGMAYWGGEATALPEGHGAVKAIDPTTGREVWSQRTPHPMVGSVLATAGDVVFAGEPTGEFDAFNARTGERLWQFRTGSGIHSSPVTYSVGGKQYVAVAAGWGGWMKGFAPELYGSTRGSALYVFALP
ncbi:MAG TPA: PQQ-dependent dehydrogenase, methanol/ethanol family [Gemmatimonadaceae bacterium]|nr:PQQ-dependent dehydrogenase, methanol/ethanol family [Gemmatimonadaceae bacterium]